MIQFKKNLLKLLGYLDAGNQHNCNKIWAILWNSLFTEFVTKFGSTQAIVLKQLNSEGLQGRSLNNIHFTFGKYLTTFLYYYVIYHIRAMKNVKYAKMHWLHTEERGKNKDISVQAIFDFFSNFYGHEFFSSELKSPLKCFFSVFFFHAHLMWWVGCSDKNILIFKN